MPISRERAVDLSHRILERIEKTSGVALSAEKEFLRNQVLRALLDWDKEHERLTAACRAKLTARGRRLVEGSREWDLALAEEMERSLAELLSRGE